MDHNEALRLHAVEKYALGELPPSLRNEFEEHYFECEECAEDVKAAAEFVERSGGLALRCLTISGTNHLISVSTAQCANSSVISRMLASKRSYGWEITQGKFRISE